MHIALDNIWKVAQWITAAEEAAVAQVNAFDTIPDPHISDSNGENFDYEENLA